MVDYTVTIELYGIKFGIYSKLNGIYMYQRSRSFSLIFVQGHSDCIIFKELLP